jgi:hypothetical protein
MKARFLWIACLLALSALRADERVLQTFKVEPDTAYELKFKTDSAEPGARWFLRIYNRHGELPLSGCYEYEWQKLAPGNAGRHLFHALRDAAELRFGVVYNGAKPSVSDISLSRITPRNMLINGDFAAGADNYSGWSETYNAALAPDGSARLLHLNNNGYALSDPVPAAGGGKYSIAEGALRPTFLLALDQNLHLVEVLAPDHKAPVMTLPAGTAYVRLFYKTWFDHIPAYREIDVKQAGLRQVDATPRKGTEMPLFDGEIILPADHDPRELRAARELQYWIGRISGREIPVLAVPSARDNEKFLLGRRQAEHYRDDLESLAGSDGYAVRRDGKRISIFGAEPRGTLFGVYALLEKNSDIIWPRPNPGMAAVFTVNPELKFTETDFRSRPVFDKRVLQFAGGHDKAAHIHQDWAGRNGLNTPVKFDRGFHYLQWVQGAMLAHGGFMISNFLGITDEDLTIYPMVDGQRKRNRWLQPCYTNPAVPGKILAKARTMLEAAPGRKIESFTINIGDNWGVCACPECMKPIPLADGGTLSPKSPRSTTDPLFFSTRHFMMLNQIADKLAAEYPDLKIGTHAYIFTAEPPKAVIHPAIVPEFAAYPTSNTMRPILEQTEAQARDWPRRFRQWMSDYGNSLGCFGYYYTDGFNLFGNTAAADYRALADNKPHQVHSEGMAFDYDDRPVNWDADASEKWILAKLMWDPYQDPDKLRDTYIARTYQDAAPIMRQFHLLLHNAWEEQKKRNVFINCHTAGNILFEKTFVETGLEQQARGLLKQAAGTAQNPVSRRIIERMLERFDAYAKALNRNGLPRVEESTAEWNDFTSPHWQKALRMTDFKVEPDWRPVRKETLSAHPTEVLFMHDGKYLYVRITAASAVPPARIPAPQADTFPAQDRVELLFRSGANTFFYTVGAGGETYAAADWGADKRRRSAWEVKFLPLAEGWGAMLKIPMPEPGLDAPGADVDVKLGRTVFPGTDKFEHSTFNGRSIFNRHKLLRTPLIVH